MQLSVSDIIQTAGIVVALLTGIISTILSVITLKQNAKIVKESNKAYIVVYPFKIYGSSIPRIKIQNFGNTSGTIIDIKTSPVLPTENIMVNPFENYKHMTIVPHQSFTMVFATEENGSEVPLEEFDVIITYKTLNETITETQHINYKFFDASFETAPQSKDMHNALDKINQSIQGLQQT